MYIYLTEAAMEQLQKEKLSNGERLRLVYDAEGCGCAVSGVVSLWIVNTHENDELLADSNISALPIYYLQRHEVFFEEKINLDYLPERRSFRLYSNGQIYTNSMSISDQRSL